MTLLNVFTMPAEESAHLLCNRAIPRNPTEIPDFGGAFSAVQHQPPAKEPFESIITFPAVDGKLSSLLFLQTKLSCSQPGFQPLT